MKITKYINGKTVAGALSYALLSLCRKGLKDFQRNRERRQLREKREKENFQKASERKNQRDEEYNEINGILHYKDSKGRWVPLENKSKSDIYFKSSKK